MERSLSNLCCAAAVFAVIVGAGLANAQELDNIERRLPDRERAAPGEEGRDSALPADLYDAPDSETQTGRFVLTAVNITGASVFPAEDFAPLYDDYLARYVSVADVATLVEAITAKYRNAGYFLSRAVAPAQEAAGGVLTVRVIEGYVDEVEITGVRSPEIQRRLEKLTGARPLRIAQLERSLLLIEDLAGVTVLSSKIEPKATDLARHKLIVELSQDRFDASIYLDNRGTEDAGVLQSYFSGSVNSVLQSGDRFSGGVFFTPEDPNELLLGQFSYATPVGRHGTTLRASFLTSEFDAGGPRAATGAQSRTDRLQLALVHPIVRRRRLTLWASAGLEGRNFEEERMGAVLFNDKLRSVNASATLRAAQLSGVTSIEVGVEHGLNILNASVDGARSRADASAEFTKLTADVSRLQNIAANFSFYISAAAQYAFDPLLASEEFSLGGSRYGRAYDFGEFKGDDGVAANVEVRYGRRPNIDFLKRYQVYGFYDFGAVWNDNAAPQFETLNLSSAGGGIRLTLQSNLHLNAEIAKPLDGAPITQGDQTWRGFFNLSKSF